MDNQFYLKLQSVDFTITSHSGDHEPDDIGGDTDVEVAEPELKEPQMYKVVLLNDDYTPMAFVVQVLMQFFGMDENKASQVMLQVHQHGKGVCGTYPRDIAETKVIQVSEFARKHEHPLLCTMEEA